MIHVRLSEAGGVMIDLFIHGSKEVRAIKTFPDGTVVRYVPVDTGQELRQDEYHILVTRDTGK